MHHSEIRDILLRDLLNRATDDDQHIIAEWLSQSDDNRRLYETLRSNEFMRRALMNDDSADLSADWSRLAAATVRRRRKPMRRIMRIAAAIAIPLAAAGALLLMNRADTPETVAVTGDIHPATKMMVTLPSGETVMLSKSDTTFVASNKDISLVNESGTVNLSARDAGEGEFTRFYVPRGGEHKVRLEDGTVIYLNSESELTVPVRFSEGKRTVSFSGEGYFEVAHDPQRPFTVSTGRAEISVLGTEFNLRAYANEHHVVTTLVTGEVEVNGADRKVRIAPGQQARVNGGLSVTNVDVYPYIAWKTGRIVFEDARTEEIMEALKRWYDFDVYYENEAMKDRLVTMDIVKYADITEVLDLIAKVNNTNYTIKGRGIFVSPR